MANQDKGKLIWVILIMAFLCVGSVMAQANSQQAAVDPKQKLQKFFDLVQKNSIDAAYDYLLEGSEIHKKPQALATLKSQTKAHLPPLGSPLGYETIKYEQLSDSLIHVISIYKTSSVPTYWEFYFYRPKSEWILVKLDYRDDPNLILK